MKVDNPFDKKMALPQVQRQTSVVTASVFMVDTLDILWAGVQSVFEDKATPELAISLLPLLLQRIDAERQSTLAAGLARMDRASAPPPAPSQARKPRGS